MGRLCIATERSPDLQKSIQTKQAHHLQNRHRNQTSSYSFFFIITFLFARFNKKKKRGKKEKKTAAQFWATASREQERLIWSHPSQAMHLIDMCARAQNWALFETKKIWVLSISKIFRLFWQCWFHEGKSASRSTVRPLKGLSASCTTFLSKKRNVFNFKEKIKKKKNNYWSIEKSKNRQKEKDSCRNTRTRESDKRWASFTVFSTAKCMEQGRALVRMPRL